jgi:hypothetical protein
MKPNQFRSSLMQASELIVTSAFEFEQRELSSLGVEGALPIMLKPNQFRPSPRQASELIFTSAFDFEQRELSSLGLKALSQSCEAKPIPSFSKASIGADVYKRFRLRAAGLLPIREA